MGKQRQTFKTDAYYRSLKPKADWQADYPDDKEPGLSLRVSPKGGKVWAFRYRSPQDCKQRRLVYGRFPDHGVAEAREWAIDRRREVASGRDPAREKKERKQREARNTIKTLNDLADSYFVAAAVGRHRPDAPPLRASTMALYRLYYDGTIKPELGSEKVLEITHDDVQGLLDKAELKSASAARHCRAFLRQLYSFAIRRRLTDNNPAQHCEVNTKTRSRDRVLTDDELRIVWNAASDPASVKGLSLSPVVGLALHFAMLTLQRGGEVCGLNTDELDLKAKTWTIPGSRTKNHRTHVVPLSEAAIAIINNALALPRRTVSTDGKKAERPEARFVFASPRIEGPITRHALSRAAQRLGEKAKVENATPHDFRRTGSTRLTGEDLGFTRFIVSQILNHASDTGGAASITGVYDRNKYLVEKRRALDAWASRLEAIVSGKTQADNIIPLPSRA